jgi:hypothetical protein
VSFRGLSVSWFLYQLHDTKHKNIHKASDAETLRAATSAKSAREAAEPAKSYICITIRDLTMRN